MRGSRFGLNKVLAVCGVLFCVAVLTAGIVVFAGGGGNNGPNVDASTPFSITVNQNSGSGGTGTINFSAPGFGGIREITPSSIIRPTRAGHIFLGYKMYYNNGGEVIQHLLYQGDGSIGLRVLESTAANPASRITIRAMWVSEGLTTFTLDPNGGSGGTTIIQGHIVRGVCCVCPLCSNTTSHDYVTARFKITTPEIEPPTRDGYRFLGYVETGCPLRRGQCWKFNHEGILQHPHMPFFSDDKVVQAVWEPDGSGGNDDEDCECEWGDLRIGETFDVQVRNMGGNGIDRISFFYRDDAGAHLRQTAFMLPPFRCGVSVPVRSGWTFLGYWLVYDPVPSGTAPETQVFGPNGQPVHSNGSPAGPHTHSFVITYTNLNNMWFEARWAQILTVTLNHNGGTNTMDSFPHTSGHALTQSVGSVPIPTRTAVDGSQLRFMGYFSATGVQKFGSNGLPVFLELWEISSNQTLTARWATRVTFDGNGFDGAVPVSFYHVLGTPLPAQVTPLPERDGFEFLGFWSIPNATGGQRRFQPDGSRQDAQSWSPTSANVTLYARWVGIPFTVNLIQPITPVTNNPTPYFIHMPGNPRTAPIPRLPQRVGHSFMGYFTGENGTGTQYFDWEGFPIPHHVHSQDWNRASDLNLYAHWIFGNRVFLDPNGGALGGTPPKRYFIQETGVTLQAQGNTSVPVPARGNFVFRGYYTSGGVGPQGVQKFDENGNFSFTGTWPHTTPVTLTARWDFQITFNANGGQGAVPEPRLLRAGAALPTGAANNATPIPDAPPGHNFGGWWDTDASSGGVQWFNASGARANANARNPETGEITLYARWIPSSFVVTLVRNPATNGTASFNHAHGATLETRVVNAPTHFGMTFLGYWTEPNGQGEQKFQPNPANPNQAIPVPSWANRNWYILGNTNLYAHWESQNLTVTLNPNGGSGGTASFTHNNGSIISTSTITPPTRSGFVFVGFYTGTASSHVDLIFNHNGDLFWRDPFVVTSVAGQTLHARWAPESATALNVTFGDYPIDDFKHIQGSQLPTRIPEMSRSWGLSLMRAPTTSLPGHTFEGWYTRVTATGAYGTRVFTNTGARMTAGNFTFNPTHFTGTQVTLYPRHVPIPLRITLDRQGGTGGTGAGTTTVGGELGFNIGWGVERTTNVNAPTRTGHIFMGYFTQPNGAGVQKFLAGGVVVTPNPSFTEDTTLYAYWEALTPNITLDFRNGGGTYSFPQAFGQQIPANVSIPTHPSGFEFMGYWNTSNLTGGTQKYDANGNRLWDDTWNFTTDQTFWARWRARIDFDTGGYFYHTVGANTPDFGVSIIPRIPRPGLIFNGFWTAQSGGTQMFNYRGNRTTAGNNWVPTVTTLYAQWIDDPWFRAASTSATSFAGQWLIDVDWFYYENGTLLEPNAGANGRYRAGRVLEVRTANEMRGLAFITNHRHPEVMWSFYAQEIRLMNNIDLRGFHPGGTFFWNPSETVPRWFGTGIMGNLSASQRDEIWGWGNLTHFGVWNSIGRSAFPFRGTFDGRANFNDENSQSRTIVSVNGLFGAVEEVIIRNVILDDDPGLRRTAAASLAAEVRGESLILNITNFINISHFVGLTTGDPITASMSRTASVGGIIGSITNDQTALVNIQNHGEVVGNVDSVGQNSGSFPNGTISAGAGSNLAVGGIVGRGAFMAHNVVNFGNVTGVTSARAHASNTGNPAWAIDSRASAGSSATTAAGGILGAGSPALFNTVANYGNVEARASRSGSNVASAGSMRASGTGGTGFANAFSGGIIGNGASAVSMNMANYGDVSSQTNRGQDRPEHRHATESGTFFGTTNLANITIINAYNRGNQALALAPPPSGPIGVAGGATSSRNSHLIGNYNPAAVTSGHNLVLNNVYNLHHSVLGANPWTAPTEAALGGAILNVPNNRTVQATNVYGRISNHFGAVHLTGATTNEVGITGTGGATLLARMNAGVAAMGGPNADILPWVCSENPVNVPRLFWPWPMHHQVHFDAMGGEPTPPSQRVENGRFVLRPEEVPTRQGYFFRYWVRLGTTTPFAFETTPVNDNFYLVAIWEDAVTISFNMNGGVSTQTPENQYLPNAGGLATQPEGNFTRAQLGGQRFAFVGWGTSPTGAPINFATHTFTVSTTLYALWYSPAVLVTFIANENDPEPFHTATIPQGTTVTRPANPDDFGNREFSHWSDTPNGTTSFNFNTSIMSDTNIYAVWTIIPIVEFMLEWYAHPDAVGYWIIANNGGSVATTTALSFDMTQLNIAWRDFRNVQIVPIFAGQDPDYPQFDNIDDIPGRWSINWFSLGRVVQWQVLLNNVGNTTNLPVHQRQYTSNQMNYTHVRIAYVDVELRLELNNNVLSWSHINPNLGYTIEHFRNGAWETWVVTPQNQNTRTIDIDDFSAQFGFGDHIFRVIVIGPPYQLISNTATLTLERPPLGRPILYISDSILTWRDSTYRDFAGATGFLITMTGVSTATGIRQWSPTATDRTFNLHDLSPPLTTGEWHITVTAIGIPGDLANSEHSNTVIFFATEQLGQPNPVHVDNTTNIVVWGTVPNTSGYIVSLRSATFDTDIGQRTVTGGMVNQFDLNDMFEGWVPGSEYEVIIQAFSNAEYRLDSPLGRRIFMALAPALLSPANFSINNNLVSWDGVVGATAYHLYVSGTHRATIPANPATYTFDLDTLNLGPGIHGIAVRAISNVDYVPNSALSASIPFTIFGTMDSPTHIRFCNDRPTTIVWDPVDFATGFFVYVNGLRHNQFILQYNNIMPAINLRNLGLSVGGTYQIQILAVNPSPFVGDVPLSGSISVHHDGTRPAASPFVIVSAN